MADNKNINSDGDGLDVAEQQGSSAYCLRQLRRDATEYDLPGEALELALADLCKMPHVIIYAERGHWGDALQTSLSKHLGVDSVSLVLHMPNWRLELPSNQSNAQTVFDYLRGAWYGVDDFMGKLHILRQFISKNSEIAKVADGQETQKSGGKINLFIRSFGSLKFQEALAFASVLRGLGDTYSGDELGCRFFVFSSTYLPFADQADCSAYEALANSYRLSGWSEQHIQNLAESFNSDGKPQPILVSPGAVMNSILEHTGGHPLLVNNLLQRLGGLPQENRMQIEKEDVEEAMRQIRASPPPQCAYWLQRLQAILAEEPLLRDRMRGYVRGETRGPAMFPPLRDEKELYVAGWLSINRLKRWGITSRFHAHLARDVVNT